MFIYRRKSNALKNNNAVFIFDITGVSVCEIVSSVIYSLYKYNISLVVRDVDISRCIFFLFFRFLFSALLFWFRLYESVRELFKSRDVCEDDEKIGNGQAWRGCLFWLSEKPTLRLRAHKQKRYNYKIITSWSAILDRKKQR